MNDKNRSKRPARSPSQIRATKNGVKTLHPNNIHKHGYDFPRLVSVYPELQRFLVTHSESHISIDFGDALSVQVLNAALLKLYYRIDDWKLPEGALCPPVPGRVDYIHHIADLLASDSNTTGKTQEIKLLDIGTGASGIYGLLAAAQYGWTCVGSDTNQDSLDSLNTIICKNPSLSRLFATRIQTDPGHIFSGIILPDEQFDISVCNPPFYDSPAAALAANQRKRNNLEKGEIKPEKSSGKTHEKPTNKRNFGGQGAELWCNGGERLFLKRMIKESALFSQQCRWFTSLVSKNENMAPSIKMLDKLGAHEVKRIDMNQGNKKTRILVWTFQAAVDARKGL